MAEPTSVEETRPGEIRGGVSHTARRREESPPCGDGTDRNRCASTCERAPPGRGLSDYSGSCCCRWPSAPYQGSRCRPGYSRGGEVGASRAPPRCLALPLPLVAPNAWLVAAALAVFGALNALLEVSMNAQAVMVEERYRRPIMPAFHALFSA